MSTDAEDKPEKLPAKRTPPTDQRITFAIDLKKHPLAKTLKKLDKDLDTAMMIVLEAMQDQDLDAKTRLTAAQYWIDKKIAISQEIAKETLARTIAEVRMLQATQPKGPKVVEEEDDDETPSVSFQPNVILAVDAKNI